MTHNMDWQTTKTVLEANEYMFENCLASDVTFRVGDSVVKAHKYVLLSRSPVFFAMFCGDLHEKTNEINIPDVPSQAFTELLRFMYCEKVNLTPDNVLPVMYASKKYIVPTMEEKCREYLLSNMDTDNVSTILVQSFEFGDETLIKQCHDFVDQNAEAVVQSDSLLTVTAEVLGSLLERDTLNVEEDVLIQKTLQWGACQCRQQEMEATNENIRRVLGDLMYLLRFPLLTIECFAEKYSNKQILLADDVIDIFRYFGLPDKPELRFSSTPRTNVVPTVKVSGDFGTEYKVVNRGTIDIDNTTVEWCYDGGADSIGIIVSKAIHLVGFGIWGSIKSKSRYNLNISVVRFEPNRDLQVPHHAQSVLSHFNTSISTDGQKKPYHILLPKQVSFVPNVQYQITLLISGPDSYAGVYRPVVATDDGVRFNFSTCPNSSNGTSEYNGQIPQILYTVTDCCDTL